MSSQSSSIVKSSATQMAVSATSTLSTPGRHKRSLDGGKIAGTVVAVVVLVLLLVAVLIFRWFRSHERKQEEGEFWHCRGKPEDLEHVPSQQQAPETFEMFPTYSISQPPIMRSVSTRTGRTMSPQSDSGYGPSPVSTIKSVHATPCSMSLVRPTLVDMPAQRSVSKMSRLVSGEAFDFQAERLIPSSSPTTEHYVLGPSGKTPSPRKTPSSLKTSSSKGLLFLPVSAASPDARPLSSASSDEPPMSPSNYIPIFFDRPTARTLAPLDTRFNRPAPSAWTASTHTRPISECSGTTIETCNAEVAGPSSAPVRPAAAAIAASTLRSGPPSAWTTNTRRTSVHSETSFETEFTDCSTDSDGEYAPALSPVLESPVSAKYPRSPPRARLSRSCTITELPPVHAQVAVRGPIILANPPG